MRVGLRAAVLVAAVVAGTVFAEASAADPGNGARLYNVHCLACHGMAGRAVLPQVPNFARGERLMEPDFMLLQSVKMGKNAMPPFMALLKDQEILDVLAYLRTLR